ncbi:hypothetical protein [Gloeocapsopsis sp. IPPAS B-1203]|uniref:hypothetical protein n=1 Tax=Gloeocapsopsis sp. IPPAS B-1203 TaxID=2049454 RepID=UPI000C17A177|nr:hypothetical protein [Gloeocapsopsis sp. IPPAS B-1203]PIG90811.1 hypothetical protein CSQ79_24500 [Gloeocapsopsis sp. IPPAS B-1203]
MQSINCDRCGKAIHTDDESAIAFLKKEYPGKDICMNCDLDLVLAASCAKQDILHNRKPGITALLMLEQYEGK